MVRRSREHSQKKCCTFLMNPIRRSTSGLRGRSSQLLPSSDQNDVAPASSGSERKHKVNECRRREATDSNADAPRAAIYQLSAADATRADRKDTTETTRRHGGKCVASVNGGMTNRGTYQVGRKTGLKLSLYCKNQGCGKSRKQECVGVGESETPDSVRN